jgi:hypothetical protein
MNLVQVDIYRALARTANDLALLPEDLADTLTEPIATRVVLQIRPTTLVEVHAHVDRRLAVHGTTNGVESVRDVLAGAPERRSQACIGELVDGYGSRADADGDAHCGHLPTEKRSKAGEANGRGAFSRRFVGARAIMAV